ncbi:MAG TPA: DUF484 family protein [Alphaproteobacteria bacterium]|nr:DUF484 family protein [Alphaproteobacteria bacterium]
MGTDGHSGLPHAGTVTAEQVVAFLRAHPDFLTRQPELLSLALPPAKRADGVVNLQDFLVQRLRGDLDRLRRQHQDLIATSRANLHAQSRIHTAALFLLDCRSFEELIEGVTGELATLLAIDAICLVVEAGADQVTHVGPAGVRVVPNGTVESWLGGRDVQLHARTDGERELFGSAAGLVKSYCLLRLNVASAAPAGLLALGSREPEMFHPGLGTEGIGFLAQVIERCIRGWLDLPPPLG